MFGKSNKTLYKIKEIKNNSVVVHHHLGLGDSIICNGIINYLTSALNITVYLPVKENYLEMMSFLYIENKKVKIFPVKNETRDKDIENFSERNKLDILKIGFDKVKKDEFNKSFYKQLDLPYEYTHEYFLLPQNKTLNNELKKHLYDYYNIKGTSHTLVHNESSLKKYELNILDAENVIYINKESDIFGNIFLYTDLIMSAKEIHCINGSFLHLVERIKTPSKLYYHHLRKNNMYLSDKWEWVDYEN